LRSKSRSLFVLLEDYSYEDRQYTKGRIPNVYGHSKLGFAPDAVMRHLSDALMANTNITELRLGGNDLGDAPVSVMEKLRDALTANTAITKLVLCRNNLGSCFTCLIHINLGLMLLINNIL